ncbi:MAG: hypothetical protein ACE5GY_08590, partial [Thermodesulfobacteriota bacterium]
TCADTLKKGGGVSTCADTLKKGGGVSPRAAVLALKRAALEPLEWEIEVLRAIPDAKDRLVTLKERKIPQAVNALKAQADREVYVERISKAVGVSIKAVDDLLNTCVDLYKELSDTYGGAAGIKKTDPLDLAERIFKWFANAEGGRFFKTGGGRVSLFWHGKIYEIGNNLDFNTLMFRLTRLAAIEKPGTTVWYYMQTLCNDRGEPIDLVRWIHTDRERDTVYINLNSDHSKILAIAPDAEPAPIDNGTNEQSVLLSSSFQIRTMEYQPAAVEAEGFRALKELIMDTTPCEKAQRYFLACWMITAFLIDYQSDRGLLQILAHTQIGKSKVAERVSQLIFGASYVGKGTGAAETRMAANNPMLFLDNLENRKLTQGTVDFLLFVANSAHKPKSKGGSDTEVLYQRLNTLAIITSIEAFPGRLPELVNRTFPLMLEDRFRQHGYMHDEVMGRILKSRSLILSSVFKMIGRRVLPRLSERAEWSRYISTEFPRHNKERMNEHICMMMLVLEGVLEHIPFKEGAPVKTQAAEILKKWIAYQEEQARQTEITSNTLLTLMDGLAREIWIKMRGKTEEEMPWREYPYLFGETKVKVYDDPEYLQTFYLTEPVEEISDEEEELTEMVQRIEFELTAADLWRVFSKYYKLHQGQRNPFENPNALGARISNDREVMERGGWEYKNRRKSKGHWYWRFSKKEFKSF